MSAGRRVMLAGASGLVGRAALAALLADAGVAEIRLLLRRPHPEIRSDDRVRVLTTEFTHLDAHGAWFEVDQVLCALGTTMRAAGSQAAFRRVDFEYPLAIGRIARAGGATHFALVSAIGADPHAALFYSRVKGELEHALELQSWPALSIARPALLLGQRDRVRVGESIAGTFGWLMPLAWRPVPAATVANALVRALRENAHGKRVIDNREIHHEQEPASAEGGENRDPSGKS